MTEILRTENLGRTYVDGGHSLSVLRGVGFSVQAGERVAIVGPSGSGKSTLLGLLAGLDQATTGSVAIAGQDLSGLAAGPLARFRGSQVGVVFQSYRLLPHCTALENVMVPLELLGRRSEHERAKTLLEQVGLAERLHHLPAKLSGGEQQRVAIARALVAGPSLLLADEPTGNLDSKTGTAIESLLFDLGADGQRALVVVTHDRALAERCDRVLELSDGDLVADRPAAAQS